MGNTVFKSLSVYDFFFQNRVLLWSQDGLELMILLQLLECWLTPCQILDIREMVPLLCEELTKRMDPKLYHEL